MPTTERNAARLEPGISNPALADLLVAAAALERSTRMRFSECGSLKGEKETYALVTALAAEARAEVAEASALVAGRPPELLAACAEAPDVAALAPLRAAEAPEALAIGADEITLVALLCAPAITDEALAVALAIKMKMSCLVDVDQRSPDATEQDLQTAREAL